MVTQDEDVGQGKKDNQLMIISESECWILSLLDISVVILLKMSVLLTSFIKLNQKTFYYGIQVFYKVIHCITFCQNFNGKYKKKWILGNN